MAASAVTPTRVQGIGVHDARINEDTITDQGAGALNSNYTQAGAKPGGAEADQATLMAIQASGTQTDKGDIELYTGRAGNPGHGAGGFLWRDVGAGETTSQYQGWDGYQVVTGVESLFRAGGTGAGGSLPSVVRRSDGKVIMVHQPADAGAKEVEIQEYDPATGAWTVLAAAKTLSGIPDSPACFAVIQIAEDDRMLMFAPAVSDRNVVMYFTDGDGSSWARGSFSVLNTDLAAGSTIREIRAAYSSGQVLLLVQYSDGANEQIGQYASTSRGARFDTVSATWTVTNDEPDAIDVTALEGGGFLMVYADGNTGVPKRYNSRRVGAAFEDFQNAEEVELVAQIPGAHPSCAVWSDEDGIVYALAAVDDATAYATRIYRSSNRGDSWEAWGGAVYEPDETASVCEINEYAATSTGGLGLLVTRYTGNGDAEDNSAVLCLFLGGHGRHTVPSTDEDVGGTPAATANFPDVAYITWAESDGSGKFGGLYLPIEEPQNVGWTATGVGTEAITSDQELEVTSLIGNNRTFDRTSTDATLTTAIAEFEVEIDSGDGDVTAFQIYHQVILSDYDGAPASATYTYSVSLRLAATGWRLYDDNAGAAVGGTTSLTLTAFKKFRIVLDSAGAVRTYYTDAATTNPQKSDWLAGPTSASLTNTTADTANTIKWGHGAITANISRWKHVGHCFWGAGWATRAPGDAGFVLGWSLSNALRPRSWSPYPVLVHDGVRVAAVDGPSYLAETWRIEPEHTYALSNILPGSNPSPRRGWRSTGDNVEQLITFKLDPDFANARLLNHALVVVLLESNLESVVVEKHDGATWSTLVTVTSTDDWTGLKYSRRGRTVIPDTGVATTGERFVFYGALKGDTIDLGTGVAADDLHKVARNTEGAWKDTVTKKPTIVLGDDNMPAGLGATATGTMAVRRKDFGAIVHSYDEDDQHLRVRIPAQHTADDDYRIGTLFIGHLAVFGHQYDRGWSVTREFDAQTFNRSGGTRRARTRAPSRRAVEISWAETAVDGSEVLKSQPDPNWIQGQSAVNLGIATPYDVVQLVEGVHEEAGGPVTPVVYVSRIPTDASATHALSDSREFVYGRLEADVRLDNVLGDEGKTELNRTNKITIREEK